MSLQALARKNAARGGPGRRLGAALLRRRGRLRRADRRQPRRPRAAAPPGRLGAARGRDPSWSRRRTGRRSSARQAVVAVPLHARAQIGGLRPTPTGRYGVAVKSLLVLRRRAPGGCAGRGGHRHPDRVRLPPRPADAGELRRLDPGGLAPAPATRNRRPCRRRGRARLFRSGARAGGAGAVPAQLPDLRARRARRLGPPAGRARRPRALRGRRDLRPAELHGGRGAGRRAGGGRGAGRRRGPPAGGRPARAASFRPAARSPSAA